MSSMDPMRDDSWILSETMRRISLRPYRFKQLQNTKSSSLMKQITRPMMYNSAYGHLLRSLLATADLSSPVTTKTKSSNHFIPVVQWLNSELKEKKEQQLPTVSSLDFEKYSTGKEYNTNQKYWLNSSVSTSQTGAESSTNAKGMP